MRAASGFQILHDYRDCYNNFSIESGGATIGVCRTASESAGGMKEKHFSLLLAKSPEDVSCNLYEIR